MTSLFNRLLIFIAFNSVTNTEEKTRFFLLDTVEVKEGDLVNLLGTIIAINGDQIKIRASHELVQVCSFDFMERRKGCSLYFFFQTKLHLNESYTPR